MKYYAHQIDRLCRTFTMAFLLSFLLYGCTARSPIPSPSYPEPAKPVAIYSPKLGPAASLYRQAESSLAQGRYRQAEMELERALRIEPRNGDYWYTMARVKYHQNLPDQAIQFSLKSKSLAGHNSDLIRLNDELIGSARQQLPH